MKKSIFIVLVLSFSSVYCQQNLVPNYSFEQKIQCPGTYDEFNGFVANWTGQGSYPTGGLCYFTANCRSAQNGVPSNGLGYQYAHSGVSYAGLVDYFSQYENNPNDYNYRDYIQVSLNIPLKTGIKYCVVWYVSLSDTSMYECSDMGAYFSDSLLSYSPTNAVKSNLTPQVANDPLNNPLTDKINWMKITGSFIATGGEQYIIIGNFKDDANSSIDSVGSNASPAYQNALAAFYYVDDVSVLEVMQARAGRDTLICIGGKALIGKDTAMPGVSYHWLPATGLSNPNAAQTFASPSVTTTYTLTEINDSMKTCGCPDSLTIDSVTVSVYTIKACCSATINYGQSVTLSVSPAYTYLWQPNTGLNNDTAQSVTAEPFTTITYTIIATDSIGCKAKDSVTITMDEETCKEVYIPNVFSPGQAINNILYVRSECIASMDFSVFDRWGNKIFESEDINKGWDGTYNGKLMNTETYIWELKATLKDGTEIERKGNVMLMR